MNTVENAGTITNPVLGNLGKMTGVEFFQNALPAAVGLVFVVGSIIFFFMLALAAIQWITSGGDKQAIEGARSKLTNAIVGIFILLASFAIIKLVELFFGVHILTLDIGPLIIQ